MKGLDVRGKVFAILEVKLLLPAFLGRGGYGVPLCGSIAKNGGAELFVNQNAGFLARHAGLERSLEAIVDHLFDSGDLGGLGRSQITVPAEHLRLERAAMVVRQDVEWF